MLSTDNDKLQEHELERAPADPHRAAANQDDRDLILAKARSALRRAEHRLGVKPVTARELVAS